VLCGYGTAVRGAGRGPPGPGPVPGGADAATRPTSDLHRPEAVARPARRRAGAKITRRDLVVANAPSGGRTAVLAVWRSTCAEPGAVVAKDTRAANGGLHYCRIGRICRMMASAACSKAGALTANGARRGHGRAGDDGSTSTRPRLPRVFLDTSTCRRRRDDRVNARRRLQAAFDQGGSPGEQIVTRCRSEVSRGLRPAEQAGHVTIRRAAPRVFGALPGRGTGSVPATRANMARIQRPTNFGAITPGIGAHDWRSSAGARCAPGVANTGILRLGKREKIVNNPAKIVE